MATISLEKSLLNEMSHIMGNDDLMAQTIKFVRSIRRKAKAKEVRAFYSSEGKGQGRMGIRSKC